MNLTVTEVAKNLLDSLKQREAATVQLAERYEKEQSAIAARYKKEQSAIDIKSKALWEQAEHQGKSIIATASAELTICNEDKKNWEEEKRKIAKICNFENNEIKLDVGGHCYTTTLTSLTRFPNTMIGAMFSGRHDLKKNAAGAYFIDRDGMHFRQILNFLRAPESFQLNLESNFAKELKAEATFYGLADRIFFNPALPEKFVCYGEHNVITQDSHGLWFIASPSNGLPAQIVQFCESCRRGIIPYENGHRILFVESFDSGREIDPSQFSTCKSCSS